jgi:membrane-bound lytic murein transglycosylase A
MLGLTLAGGRAASARLAALSGVLLLLAACASPRAYAPQPSFPHPPLSAPGGAHAIGPQPPIAAAAPIVASMAVADLPGWAGEDHAAALDAYRISCGVAQDGPARGACAEARRLGHVDQATARRFFETRFRAEPVGQPGLLTAYFAPEYEAQPSPDEIFSAPVRPRPPELVRGPDGRFQPWKTRAEIEADPGEALAFMRPEDLFFLQIQGSGFLTLPDGRRLRAAYAADNGQPCVGIARPLVDRGLMGARETSGEGIRAWLGAHRGPEAQAITDLNPRYVFFVLTPDNAGQPLGSAGLALPPGRAAAIDPTRHAYGELLWLDADGGALSGAAATYRRLVTALDTGGAIKGPARVDLYLGRGPAAGTEAGRVKHPLRLFRLIPVG